MLTSPGNRMTVVYESVDGSTSNVAFTARYWSTFENQAAPSDGASSGSAGAAFAVPSSPPRRPGRFEFDDDYHYSDYDDDYFR